MRISVPHAAAALALIALPIGTVRGSPCGPIRPPGKSAYGPIFPIPDTARPPSDATPPPPPDPAPPPDPTTPTDPPPPPSTPTTPTEPAPPSAPPTPAATPSAPATPDADRADRTDRRKAAPDYVAWEVWWGVHRFEFLKPADHSAEITGEVGGPAYETTRRAVRPRLLELANSSQNYWLRGAALAAALRFSTPEQADTMGDAVRRALRSHNLELAMGVGNALSYASAASLIPAVHPIAADEIVEAHVRGLIALALPSLWHDAADGLLVKLLEKDSGSDAPFTEGLLMAFGSTHGPEGTVALERVVRDRSMASILRATALTSLARRGLESRSLLLASIEDSRVEVRRAAATGLGILPWATATPDAATLSALRRTGENESAEALEGLLERLGAERADALRDGPAREACLRLGRVLLRERDRSVRAAAAVSLGRIARAIDAPIAVGILLADLARTRDLREYDLLALGISHDARALPRCLAALRANDSAPTTRAAAAIALGLFGAEIAVTPLARVLADDASPEVRGYVAVSLGMLKSTSSLVAIRKGFDTSRNLDAVGQFAVSLGLFGETKDGDRLTARLARGGSPVLQFNLAEALRLLARPGPTKALLAIAEDSESDAGVQAARAIAAILAPNDGGKPERVKAFDHIGGEDYLLGYVVDP